MMINVCRSVAYITMRKHADSVRSAFKTFKRQNSPLRSTVFFFVVQIAAVSISLYGTSEQTLNIASFAQVDPLSFGYLFIFSLSTVPFLVLILICTTMLVCRSLLIASYLRVKQCKHHSEHFLISRKLPKDIGVYVRCSES